MTGTFLCGICLSCPIPNRSPSSGSRPAAGEPQMGDWEAYEQAFLARYGQLTREAGVR